MGVERKGSILFSHLYISVTAADLVFPLVYMEAGVCDIIIKIFLVDNNGSSVIYAFVMENWVIHIKM